MAYARVSGGYENCVNGCVSEGGEEIPLPLRFGGELPAWSGRPLGGVMVPSL